MWIWFQVDRKGPLHSVSWSRTKNHAMSVLQHEPYVVKMALANYDGVSACIFNLWHFGSVCLTYCYYLLVHTNYTFAGSIDVSWMLANTPHTC